MSPRVPSNRDDFNHRTKRIIAQRSGFRCAICGCQTEGPGLDHDKAVSIGDAAHITAASPKGPRYDANLTSEQRADPSNGLWACKNHHWIIDHDPKRYTVVGLIAAKRRAEDAALRLLGLEAAQGTELLAAIVTTWGASDRMIAQWREKYRYNEGGVLELDLEEKAAEGKKQSEWTLSRVTAAVAQGHKLLLVGPPGAGKTITLIQVAEQLSTKAGGPVPLLFSVSGWLASNRDLVSHVVALLANHGVSGAAVGLLLATGQVVLLLNGWNEVPDNDQARASELLNDFLLSYSLPGVILSTRATRCIPSLVGETVLKVLPLTAAKREAVIKASNSDPESLLRQIEQSPILEQATKTPLFLAAAVRIAGTGRKIPQTRSGLLESFLADLEKADNHAAHLGGLPCQGCHYYYQADLAAEMTRVGATVLPHDRVLAIIGASSISLTATGLIGQVAAAAAIAESLAKHHALLYLSESVPSYGFIHQQFQEWFASRWLLSEVRRLAAHPNSHDIYLLQRDYLNLPAWQEAIAFVMESLVSDHAAEIASALVRWMMPVDLIRAAELINLGDAAVWGSVMEEMGRALRSWYSLGDAHRDCALTAMLATGQPDFSDLIWPYLENDEQAVFRIGELHRPFRLAVLGTDAADRLAKLPEEVEATFLRVISEGASSAEIEYADTRARQGAPLVRVSALRLLVEQGRFSRALTILFSADFVEWDEDIYTEVIPQIPTALLIPHANAVRSKFDTTESLLLRSGIVECLRRVGHLEWADLAKADLNRALIELREDWSIATRRKASESSATRVIARYIPMLLRIDKEWMGVWLVEKFDADLADLLLPWLDKFPEDALVAVAACIVSGNCSGFVIEKLFTSGFLRVARVFVDAYITATIAGQEPLDLPSLEGLRPESSIVLPLLFDAILAKAETVDDFAQMKALIGTIAPRFPLDGALGEQIAPEQRDGLRALVLRATNAIPSEEVAHHCRPTLAVLLGSLGASEDVAVVRSWIAEENIRWDKCRRQLAEAKVARPPRLVHYVPVNYCNWYSGALALFRCPEAEQELLGWLNHPWLPAEGAEGLVALSFMDGSLSRFPKGRASQRAMSLAGHSCSLDDIGSRADAVVCAIERIEALSAKAEPRCFLPQMIAALGRLHDERAIDRLLALDGTKYGWTIVETCRCLQAGGVVLPGRRLALILEPFIVKYEAFNYASDYQWHWHMVVNMLRLLLFSDSPIVATERIRRLPSAHINSYHAKDIFDLLGQSPTPEAADLLLEYSDLISPRAHTFPTLVDVLAMSLDTRCHVRLLELHCSPRENGSDRNQANLYHCILHIARSDAEFRDKLIEAIRRGPSQWEYPQSFCCTVSDAELLELMLAGEDLRPIEQELTQFILGLSETYEPKGDGWYHVLPVDMTVVRQKLAQVLPSGGENAKVASRFLASLRLKRATVGNPAREPLHPDVSLLESGAAFWPVCII